MHGLSVRSAEDARYAEDAVAPEEAPRTAAREEEEEAAPPDTAVNAFTILGKRSPTPCTRNATQTTPITQRADSWLVASSHPSLFLTLRHFHNPIDLAAVAHDRRGERQRTHTRLTARFRDGHTLPLEEARALCLITGTLKTRLHTQSRSLSIGLLSSTGTRSNEDQEVSGFPGSSRSPGENGVTLCGKMALRLETVAAAGDVSSPSETQEPGTRPRLPRGSEGRPFSHEASGRDVLKRRLAGVPQAEPA